MTNIKNKKMFKCLYFVLIIAFLCQCFLIITNNTFSPKENSWQNFASYNFEQQTIVNPDGKTEIVNLISTPEQLAGAFKQSSYMVYADDHSTIFPTSYKLANNIDLSGKTWSPATNSVTLDGNFCTISNLTISSTSDNVGFVSTNSGTIKNLYFKNVSVTNTQTSGSATNTGTIAGKNTGTITNCVVLSGSVTGNNFGSKNNDREVGGIAGRNSGTITKCTNHASINIGKHVGGIVGVSTAGTIQANVNYGSVSCGPNQYQRLGGIVGEITAGTLNKCLNYGIVSNYYKTDLDEEEITITDVRVGGIAGMTKIAISECGNEGQVTASYYKHKLILSLYISKYPSESYAGGIAGYSESTFTNCYNTGKISSNANTTYTLSESYAYDILGAYKNLSTGDLYSTTIHGYEYGFYSDNSIIYGENSFFHVRMIQFDSQESLTRKKYSINTGHGYAYGIGYSTTSSTAATYCFNTGKISGGAHPITTYEFKDMYLDNGWGATTDIKDFSLNFHENKQDYGYISNKSVSNCYYLPNSAAAKYISYTYDDSTSNYSNSDAMAIDQTYSLKDTTQHIMISKSASSDRVTVIINDENMNSSNQENFLQFGGAVTSYATYYTYSSLSSQSFKGSSRATQENLNTAITNYFASNVWCIDNSINNGKPFLKCFYWKYS